MINLTVVIDNEEALRKFRELQRVAKNTTSSVVTDSDRMDVAMRRFATTLGQIGVGVSLASLVRQIATTRGEFQQLEVAFTTLLQNKEKADALMRQMVDLAATTPFDLQGVANGARQLLAYGFAAEDITDTLTRLGNVAAGLGLPLERLTYLYGTTAVQGRVYARDMLQFTGSGIPVLQEMAKMYGKTTEEINEMVSAGKIGFEDVKKVIENMTNAGGQFYNLMENQSKTITGLISNLGDAIDTMFNDIGKSQEGVISSVLQGTISLVENYQRVLDILIPLVAAYGAYKAAIITTAALQKTVVTASSIKAFFDLAKGITTAKDAQLLFNMAVKANPLGLALSLLTLIGTAIYRYSKNTTNAAKATAEYNRYLSEEKSGLDEAFKNLSKAEKGTKDRGKAIDGINSKYGEYLSNMLSEASNANDIALAYKEISKAINDTALAKAKTEFVEEPIKELQKAEKYFWNELSDFTKELSPTAQGAFTKEIEQIINKTRQGGLETSEYDFDKFIQAFRRAWQLDNPNQNISSSDVIDIVGGWDVNQVATGYQRIVKAANDLKQAEADFADFSKAYITSDNENIEEQSQSITTASENLKKAQEAYNTAKAEWQNAIKEGADVTVVTEKKSAVDAAEKALKEAKELAGTDDKAAQEARRRADREREEQTRASENLIELLTQLRNDALQTEIDAMAEGTDKKIAQINYDYDRREEAIKKREEELERLAAQAGTEVSEQDRGYLSALRTDNELTHRNALSQIEIDEIEAEERAMDEYLAKYGDYQEKRFAITKQYADKIAKAQTEGEKLLYGKQEEEALRNLDLSMVEVSNLWLRLFKDAGTMATSSINGVIEDVERLLKYIEQVQSGGDADMSILAALGLTKEQVDTLMADPKKIEAILDALKQKRDELNARNPFSALIQGFKDLKNAARDADAQMAAVNKIIEGAQGTAQLIGDVGDSMSELGEAIGSDFVSGFSSAMSEISYVANSAINGAIAGMAVGGPVGAAIGAGIGVIMGVISVIGKRLQYNKQVREEYQNTLRKEYLAEYEINALYRERYEWAKKIGEATLSYLNRNTKEAQIQYEANQREQEELWAKLMGSEYVSSKRYKHGTWFRKAKIIKGYSTLAGKSWEDIELLAAQGKLTKEAQEYYEALKKAREEGEELEERMEQIAEETREAFTGIGFDSLVDGIVEGFKSGKRSMSDFADDFEDMMKNAVLQSLKMTALEEPLRKWYEDFAAAAGDDDGLTQQEIEELKASYARIIENAGRQADDLERITGVSLGTGADTQTATARGFQAMSQETGSELNGRFTAIQGDVHDIKAFVIEQTNNGTQLLNETVNIRDIMIQLNGNVADIRTYTKVLPMMSETLILMNKKLDNL